MRRWAIAAVLFAFVITSVPAAPIALAGPDPDPVKEAQKQFAADIDKAITKGVEYFVAKQNKDGSYPGWENSHPVGYNSLIQLAMIKCRTGNARKDKELNEAIDKCWVFLKKSYEERKGMGAMYVYDISILIMALEAHATPVKKPGYKVGKVKLNKPDLKWMEECTEWLIKNQATYLWRYPGGDGGGGKETEQDMSNTQYAVLALSTATRCGIDVKEEIFFKALQETLRWQKETGPLVPRINPKQDKYGYWSTETVAGGGDHARGFAYMNANPGGLETGAMTTAGIAAIVICKSQLMKYKPYLESEWYPKTDKGIYDALAWLAKNFTVESNPGGQGWHFYYLYGLERAGTLTDKEFIGTYQWYNLGAKYLLRTQSDTGYWNAGANPAFQGAGGENWFGVDTAYALLFLKRATVPVDVPIVPPAISGAD
jgi:hypothetical protein